MNKRNQYTAPFKKPAILLAEERGNSSALRHLGVIESTVRGLRKCRDRILRAAPTRKVFRWPKTGRFPKIEEDLAEFVRQHRSHFLPVNAELVQIKARELAREASVPRDTFKASSSWVQKFMRRASLCTASTDGTGCFMTVAGSAMSGKHWQLKKRDGNECD
ncbi:hypothetical protein HPB52_013688 [Rhipicephalus sanguineus]|uniref:HTH CENPB-type domain-containing protein n=1 Tax=Rhipicephalus sanguineus TaxID=34632 RepID=A0A9D4Q6P5_RHISA|nr:hypothetical protein HPB52_013688 [Rhipicephalus sanguineus]